MKSARTFTRSLASAAAAGALVTSGAALAQISDSATAQANADIVVVQPPLAVDSVTDLTFGTVSIPNGTVPGNRCSYSISGADAYSRVRVVEESADGVLFDAILPTPSFCEASDAFSAARFAITCNVATPTTVSLTLVSPFPTSEMRFTEISGVAMTAVQKGATSGALNFGPASGINVTCPDGTASGSTEGAFDVLVGGRLLLFETANPASDVNVGTITLTASY